MAASKQQKGNFEINENQKRRRFEAFRIIRRRFKRGIASFEIANLLGVPLHWVSGRLTELKNEDGVIVETGETRINPDSGRPCAVVKPVNSMRVIEEFLNKVGRYDGPRE